jgi:hypothetical protein
MKLIQSLTIIIVLASFFFLIKHYINLENYKFNYDKSRIPIIEADNKPFKILPPPDDNDKADPLEESCTLNDEC